MKEGRPGGQADAVSVATSAALRVKSKRSMSSPRYFAESALTTRGTSFVNTHFNAT